MSNQDNTKKIPLSQGKFALVDAEDYERLMKYNWCASWNGRNNGWIVHRQSAKRDISMTREIMLPPRGARVMFKDHDSLNLRRANLQIVSHSESRQHGRLRKNKTSIYKGVHWDKESQKWRALIEKDGKHYYLGRFSNEEDAARTHDEKALELYGDTALLNFSDNNGTPAVANCKFCRGPRRNNTVGNHVISRPKKTGSSQFKGVHWCKTRRRWIAKIGFKGKTYHLGNFVKESDAARAYDEAAVKMFGEGAYLNFPQKRLKHAQ